MGYIQYELREGVGLVTFSRPEALNALSEAAVAESLRFFQELGGRFAEPGDPALRAVVLTGAGKAFIGGADVKEMAVMNPEQAASFCALGNRLMNEIERFPLPVIAAVNGYAFGGGFEVALAADFIYAAASARFSLPEVNLGIIPGFGGVRRLCWRIGTARAKELLYSGRQISAQEALELGIVNRVIPPEQLAGQALQAAAALANAGPAALRAAKRHAGECLLLDPEAAAGLEAGRFGALFAGEEPVEGMSALQAKRKPAWARKEG